MPLKSDHVFRLALKENAFIQPFSIVWIPINGTIRNKVVVHFGHPINCEGRDRKSLMEMWNAELMAAIERSNKLIEKLWEIDKSGEGYFTRKKKCKMEIRKYMVYI